MTQNHISPKPHRKLSVKIPKQVSLRIATALILCSIILAAGFSILYMVLASAPSSTFWLAPGIYPGAPSYTVWREGNNYFAKNANGELEYGETNASYVINSVITENSAIYLAFGTYQLSASIEINAKSVTLYSDGRGESEMANHGGAVLTPTDDSFPLINITEDFATISGITIFGDRANRDGNIGIAVEASHIDILHNRILYTSKEAVKVSGSRLGINIAYNEFRECVDYEEAATVGCLDISGMADSFISFNEISGLKTGIYGNSFGATTIQGNKIFPVTYGCYFDSPQRVSFIGNIVEPAVTNLTEYAFYVVSYGGGSWGKYNRIVGNEISGGTSGEKGGLYFKGSSVTNNTVTSNTIRQFDWSGIEEDDSADWNVYIGNTLINTGYILTEANSKVNLCYNGTSWIA